MSRALERLLLLGFGAARSIFLLQGFAFAVAWLATRSLAPADAPPWLHDMLVFALLLSLLFFAAGFLLAAAGRWPATVSGPEEPAWPWPPLLGLTLLTCSALAALASRLKKMAEDNNVMMKFEATVGGTMPLISLVERTLVGNTILGIRGIFNGTCNYILTRMTEEGIPYTHALSEAQDLGIAEADPSYDVEGVNTAGKVVILANSLFNMNIKYSDVDVTGITGVTPEALALAKKRGYAIKLIGDVPALTVRPTLVPLHSPIAVAGTLNSAATMQ